MARGRHTFFLFFPPTAARASNTSRRLGGTHHAGVTARSPARASHRPPAGSCHPPLSAGSVSTRSDGGRRPHKNETHGAAKTLNRLNRQTCEGSGRGHRTWSFPVAGDHRLAALRVQPGCALGFLAVDTQTHRHKKRGDKPVIRKKEGGKKARDESQPGGGEISPAVASVGRFT